MRGGRCIHWVLFVLALAAVAVLIWVLSGGPQTLPPGKQFADGSTITIRKITYGMSIRYPMGNFWQRAAVQMLPSKLSKRFGLKMAAYTNAHNSVFVVVENHLTNGTFSAGMAMPFNFGNTVVANDDAGNGYQLWPAVQLFRASNDVVEIYVAPMVSHLATNLHVEVTQVRWFPPFTNYTADFDVANPAPRVAPKWTAARLPITNQIDDLTLIIEGIDPAPMSWQTMGGVTRSIPKSRPVIRVLEHGESSRNWSLAGFTTEDQEGNVAVDSGQFSPREPRKFVFQLLHVFPAEPGDSVSFRDVPIGEHANARAPLQADFRGHNIRISSYSPGKLTYQILPALENFAGRFTISYADDTGATITALKDHPAGASGGNMGFSYRAANQIKSADITFTFARTTNRVVEFLAYPEPARTNSVPK